MLAIPDELQARFDTLLSGKSVPVQYHYYYRKWLRYYLDFCRKYNHNASEKQSLSLFLRKLQEKRQKEYQIIPELIPKPRKILPDRAVRQYGIKGQRAWPVPGPEHYPDS